MKDNNKTDITNVIGYIAIAVIVISLIFITFRITGLATTDTATVNVTIASSASINFTVDFLEFGSGTVNSGPSGATINSEGSVTNGTWTPTSANLALENIGNTNVSINISSNKNATSFIGGSSPSFKIRAINKTGENNACGSPLSTYTEIGTTNLTLCNSLGFNSSIDEVNISIQLYIPNDAIGAKTATLTAYATSV